MNCLRSKKSLGPERSNLQGHNRREIRQDADETPGSVMERPGYQNTSSGTFSHFRDGGPVSCEADRRSAHFYCSLTQRIFKSWLGLVDMQ